MKTEVLIIGGGITGCALAYFLAKAGAKAILIERHDLNTQASGSNAGSIHAQMDHAFFAAGREGEAEKHVPMTLVLMAAIEFWKAIEKELEADFELDVIGGLLVADKPEHMGNIERKVAFERRLGLPVELLSAGDVRRIAPYVSDTMIGGALCPIEGEANALVVAPIFAAAAARHGATLMTGTELLALAKLGSSFVAETSRGRIEARRVVNCAGAAAGAVGRLAGIELPIRGEPIQVNVTEPAAPLVRHLVHYAGRQADLEAEPARCPDHRRRLAGALRRGREARAQLRQLQAQSRHLPACGAEDRERARHPHLAGPRQRDARRAPHHRRGRPDAGLFRRELPEHGVHGWTDHREHRRETCSRASGKISTSSLSRPTASPKRPRA